MHNFSKLISQINESKSTPDQIHILSKYFHTTDSESAAWTVYFLLGNKLKKLVKTSELQNWCIESTNTPEWLFRECLQIVGDKTETIALLWGKNNSELTIPFYEIINQYYLPLENANLNIKKSTLLSEIPKMNTQSLFIFNKLISGGFRSVLSRSQVYKAIASYSGVPVSIIAHRLSSLFIPSSDTFKNLCSTEISDANLSKPYPFCEITKLNENTFNTSVQEWIAEWKWTGIRVQLIKRNGEIYIWSNEVEYITENYPEIINTLKLLKFDCVLEGVLIAGNKNTVLAKPEILQKNNHQSKIKKIQSDLSVVCKVYDILEFDQTDLRHKPLSERRKILAELSILNTESLHITEPLVYESWSDLERLRNQSEVKIRDGLILKRKDSIYDIRDKIQNWLKWKPVLQTVFAVLIYARPMQGIQTSKLTDLSFALWDQDQLKIFATSNTGLSLTEILDIDTFIKTNTLEKFGPVRTVKPELVFEIGFEGIIHSPRHKTGFTVKSPQILRWCKDKKPADADNLDKLKRMFQNQ